MDKKIQFTYLEEPAQDVVGGGISDYNKKYAGGDSGKNLCFVQKNDKGDILGGLIEVTYWNWLFINLMWLPEDLRGQGYGQKLLALAEEEEHHRGAQFSYLDTFSFQAPEFYKKFGYQEFGELEDFPPGHTRHFMKKDL